MEKKWEKEMEKNKEEWKQQMQEWLLPTLEMIQKTWKGEGANVFLEMGYELEEQMQKYGFF